MKRAKQRDAKASRELSEHAGDVLPKKVESDEFVNHHEETDPETESKGSKEG